MSGQFVYLGAEEVDALAAGDLGVEVEFLRDLADGDELVGGDLAAGDAGHHRIRAVFLHVGEVVVVGVLEDCGVALEDEVVPAGGEDGGDRGLADVAAAAAAVLVDECLEALDPADAHEVVQLLARVGKMLAEVVADGEPLAGELCLEYLGDQRATAPTGAGSARGLFQGAERGAAGFDGGAERALGDVVTRADEGGGGQCGHAEGGLLLRAPFEHGEDEFLGLFGQGHVVQHHGQPGVVVGGVADENAP